MHLPLSLTAELQGPDSRIEGCPYTPLVACEALPIVLSHPAGALSWFSDQRCLLELKLCLTA